MKKWLLLSVIVILIIFVVLYFWAGRPVKTIIVSSGAGETTQSTPERKLKIENKFFLTYLPAGYRVNEEQSPNERLQIVVVKPDSSSQVAFTASQIGQNHLEDLSDYVFRIKNANTYAKENWKELPMSNEVFVKNDGQEITVFIVHKGHYAIVSATGLLGLQDLKALLTGVLKQWVWKI
ncbi:hypothetical protein KBB76_01880 [Candidatus Saccharibacteria bacterium]|jgi:hypothetical protein|nr:hypothetical protein [Candidatus Saccharibacteria bacterium]HPW48039.1 hypothetical protein [Candidatus Saccharibacteria bacterium]